MKDTRRIDEEIASLNKKINQLEALKLKRCINCEDEYCMHAGTINNGVCQSHTLYGVEKQ